jgi:hypothetical protein
VDRLRNRATRRYYLANGEFDKAWESATEGLQITTGVFRFGVGAAQRVLGRITRARGEFNDAERQLTQALETFASIDARFEVGAATSRWPNWLATGATRMPLRRASMRRIECSRRWGFLGTSSGRNGWPRRQTSRYRHWPK